MPRYHNINGETVQFTAEEEPHHPSEELMGRRAVKQGYKRPLVGVKAGVAQKRANVSLLLATGSW